MLNISFSLCVCARNACLCALASALQMSQELESQLCNNRDLSARLAVLSDPDALSQQNIASLLTTLSSSNSASDALNAEPESSALSYLSSLPLSAVVDLELRASQSLRNLSRYTGMLELLPALQTRVREQVAAEHAAAERAAAAAAAGEPLSEEDADRQAAAEAEALRLKVAAAESAAREQKQREEADAAVAAEAAAVAARLAELEKQRQEAEDAMVQRVKDGQSAFSTI